MHQDAQCSGFALDDGMDELLFRLPQQRAAVPGRPDQMVVQATVGHCIAESQQQGGPTKQPPASGNSRAEWSEVRQADSARITAVYSE